jgi:general stress protein YciG
MSERERENERDRERENERGKERECARERERMSERERVTKGGRECERQPAEYPWRDRDRDSEDAQHFPKERSPLSLSWYTSILGNI